MDIDEIVNLTLKRYAYNDIDIIRPRIRIEDYNPITPIGALYAFVDMPIDELININHIFFTRIARACYYETGVSSEKLDELIKQQLRSIPIELTDLMKYRSNSGDIVISKALLELEDGFKLFCVAHELWHTFEYQSLGNLDLISEGTATYTALRVIKFDFNNLTLPKGLPFIQLLYEPCAMIVHKFMGDCSPLSRLLDKDFRRNIEEKFVRDSEEYYQNFFESCPLAEEDYVLL